MGSASLEEFGGIRECYSEEDWARWMGVVSILRRKRVCIFWCAVSYAGRFEGVIVGHSQGMG